jgi:hypothetical protein
MERNQKREINEEFECNPLGFAELWRKSDKMPLSRWYSKQEKAYFDQSPRHNRRQRRKHVLRRIASVSCRRRRLGSALAIESLFTVKNRREVGNFLRESPFLVSLAIEARIQIKKYFPESELVLETVNDPEGLEPDQLFLYISTNESPREARPKLKALDREWWLAALDRAQGKLCISLEYQ